MHDSLMKFFNSITFIFILFLVRSTGYAQGYVWFANVTQDLTIEKPIEDIFTGEGLTSSHVAQLFAGPDGSPSSALCPVDAPVQFLDGAGFAGLFLGPLVQIPGIPPGETGTFEVRVWQVIFSTWDQAYAHARVESFPRLARSGPFAMKTGDQLTPTEVAVAMPRFALAIIPEPSPVSLAGLGVAGIGFTLFTRRTR
mgnify:CR=1 FL=1